MRTNPVTRDSVVAIDMVAVERAIDGALMGASRSYAHPARGRQKCTRLGCLLARRHHTVTTACHGIRYHWFG
jgi:hypothetical protein